MRTKTKLSHASRPAGRLLRSAIFAVAVVGALLAGLAPASAATAQAVQTRPGTGHFLMSSAAARQIRKSGHAPAPVVTDRGGDRSKAGLTPPPMSSAMIRANAAKQRLAKSFLARHRPGVIPCCGGGGSEPNDLNIAGSQQAQQTSYWCGPATAAEALKAFNVSKTQSQMATSLGTTTNGTDWSDSGGYPTVNTMDAYESTNGYVAVALPANPTSSQITTFEDDDVTDVYGVGAPLLGDAYETYNGPHLVGHPNQATPIYHWFDIRGYEDKGVDTDYEDSVHGASSISWSSGVPAYSTLASSTIVQILGGRGYDW